MVHLKIFPAILVSCIMILAGCSSDDSPTASTNGDDGSTEDPIVGTWELDGYELTFNADGTYTGVDDGEFDEEGTWSISGNNLTIDGSDGSGTNTFSISDDTLTITLSDGEQDSYTRKGQGGTAGGDPATVIGSGIRGTVTDLSGAPVAGFSLGPSFGLDIGFADPLSDGATPGKIILSLGTDRVLLSTKAITPNGDGIYDAMFFTAADGQLTKVELFGASDNSVRVIESSDPVDELAWDGRDDDGDVLAIGHYTAVVTLASGDDVSFEVVSMISQPTGQNGEYSMSLPAGTWSIGFDEFLSDDRCAYLVEIIVDGVSTVFGDEDLIESVSVEVPSGEMLEVNWTIEILEEDF